MQHLTEKRLAVLSHPNLITKWHKVFHVASLRSLLREYEESEESLSEICDESLDSTTAVHQLHRHVLLKNDDNLYSAIVDLCEKKCSVLSDLINILWLDMDDTDDKHDDDKTSLTKNQFNLLSFKGEYLKESLETILDAKSIQHLLREHSPQVDDEPTVALLHRQLLLRKNKLFYVKFVKLLRNKLDEYRDCCSFMTNVDEVHDDLNEHHDDVKLWTVCLTELTVIKSQLVILVLL